MQQTPAELIEAPLSFKIILFLFWNVVREPIDFDDQLLPYAGEIRNVAIDRMLAAEFEPFQPAIAQQLP